jgi:hypothetical protein
MRLTLIARCLAATFVLGGFAAAQSLQPVAANSGSRPDVGFEFDRALRAVSYVQETPPDPSAPGITDPIADAADPMAETDPMGETDTDPMADETDPLAADTLSDAVNCCPRCHCMCCMCPEPAKPCDPCPRVNNLNPAWNLVLGGWVTMDSLYNSARPIAPGTPFFLAPEAIFNEDTFDIHARQTTIYLAAQGPQIGKYVAGGLIMFNLYNDSLIVDRYGFLPYQAWGELKNEDWRFAGGLQMDIFAPVLPTVLPFSYLAASGNTGVYRGQFRAERFYHPSTNEQITLTVGISDANPTYLNEDILTEDNGWPNMEGRAAWAVGALKQEGLAAVRPFEVGVSGFVGEIRTTQIVVNQVIDNTWGLAGDFRWRVNQKWGFQGEIFTGQGLGTYGGGIMQTVNSDTFEAIESSGAWGEFYYYCHPCIHTHMGYGIDNPNDADLAPTQVSRNDTIFGNVIWDVTKSFRLASELTYRTTDYLVLPDNEGFGIHWQMQWKF